MLSMSCLFHSSSEEISGVDGGERSTSEGRGSKRRQREKRSRKAVAPRRFFDVADELAREVEEEFGPGIVTGGSSSSTSSGGRMEGDLLGDGGVIKTIIKAGEGPMVVPGSRVTVNYKGQTQEGQMVFCGGQDYKFQANDGSMVSGWDVALTTMRVGEKARVVVAPRYGYGSKGVPPVIGPDTSLEFEVEVLSLDKAFAPTNFRELDPTNTRDIQSITQDYDRRTALRMRNEEGKSMMDKTQDWFKSLYFFGFFEGATGERPPWYLTPTLTFPFMFALVAAAFYVLASNGGISLKRDAKGIQDDLEMGAALLDHIWG